MTSTDPQVPVSDEAVSALEAYFRSANAAAKGADIEAHERTYAGSCAACVDATDDFAQAQERGLHADGDRFAEWTIDTERDETRQAFLTSVIRFDAVNLVDGDQNVVESVPAWSDATFAWTLRKQPDGTWLIIQGQLLQ